MAPGCGGARVGFYFGLILAPGMRRRIGAVPDVATWDVPEAIPTACPHRRPPLGRCRPASSGLNPFVSEAIQFI